MREHAPHESPIWTLQWGDLFSSQWGPDKAPGLHPNGILSTIGVNWEEKLIMMLLFYYSCWYFIYHYRQKQKQKHVNCSSASGRGNNNRLIIDKITQSTRNRKLLLLLPLSGFHLYYGTVCCCCCWFQKIWHLPLSLSLSLSLSSPQWEGKNEKERSNQEITKEETRSFSSFSSSSFLCCYNFLFAFQVFLTVFVIINFHVSVNRSPTLKMLALNANTCVCKLTSPVALTCCVGMGPNYFSSIY